MQTTHFPQLHTLVKWILIGCFLIQGCDPSNDKTNSDNAGGKFRIHDIQGCSHSSPYNGQQISQLFGIVTWKTSNGFYMQDPEPDDQFCSSEAIFVFTNTYPAVIPGDGVFVSGQIDEYQPGNTSDANLTITQLTNPRIQVISSGNDLPQATLIGDGEVSLPLTIIEDDDFREFDPIHDGIDFFESLESMLVRVETGVVVGPRNQFNEIVIIPEDTLPGNAISRTGALIQQESDTNPERIMLNLNNENRELVNVGAQLNESVTGILDYSYGNFKINVFGIAKFIDAEKLQLPAIKANDSLRVVSYNVENLSRFDDSRVKRLVEEISKLLGKPDVVILHEIMDDSGVEDDGEVSAATFLTYLVSQIELKSGISYGFIDNPPRNDRDGGVEGGNIRSVLLYRKDMIKVVDRPISGLAENPTRIGSEQWPFSSTRKPLMVLLEFKENPFLLVAPHLTSRSADTPLFGAMQPIQQPEKEKRIAQADLIYDELRIFHLNNPDIPIILAGDLNDDPWSETIKVLKGDLLSDLGENLPTNERFSYILDGNAIQIDHILAYLADKWQASFKIIHSNSIYDYTLQSSDHDPVMAEFLIP